jgi:uncharacterized surface protein with fasciclin (FAS1) repeats
MKNLVQTAIDAGQFSTLVSAIQAADLVETLSGNDAFTVFAPTDEAFAKLPRGTVESLLDDKVKLAEILKYHVVSGKIVSADVAKMSTVTSVQGGSLMLDTSDGARVNGSKIIQADIEASNGVIHVIDSVLLPE